MIRRAYRELSKQYHPDTTDLPVAIAKEKFQQLNEAYGTLSNPESRNTYDLKHGYSRFSVPESRNTYDLKHGYSRFSVIQTPIEFRSTVDAQPYQSRSAYLDPSDRPLSGGELFALCLLGITFIGCVALVILVGISRGELAV